MEAVQENMVDSEDEKLVVLGKLNAIFETSPWLKDSKNIVHIPISKTDESGKRITLPGVSWCELHMLTEGIAAQLRLGDGC